MLNARGSAEPLWTCEHGEFPCIAAEFLPAGSDDAKFENFFEQWVYGTGIPASEDDDVRERESSPRACYRRRSSRSNVNEDFSISVPVEMQLPGKRVSDEMGSHIE